MIRALPRVNAAANLAGDTIMNGKYNDTAMKMKKRPLPMKAAKYVSCAADGIKDVALEAPPAMVAWAELTPDLAALSEFEKALLSVAPPASIWPINLSL